MGPLDRLSLSGGQGSYRFIVGLLLGAAALFALVPFLTTLRPPMQDLPQHLAAGRVLLDAGNEALNFDAYFTADWLRSQYLGIYLLMGAFFYPLRWFVDEPLLVANRMALVVLLASWVGGMEWCGRKLTRRVGFGAFALALFYNVHLILGFLNFLLGTGFAFVGLALFASLRSPAPRFTSGNWRIWALGTVSLACFYFHVVPFAILGALIGGTSLGDALLARLRTGRVSEPSEPLRAHWSTYTALVPALVATLAWLATPAGTSTREAASGGGARGKAHFPSFEDNQAALPSWTMDAFRSEWDTQWLLVLLTGFGVYLVAEVALLGAQLLVARRGVKGASETDARTLQRDDLPLPEVDRVLLWLTRLAAPTCLTAYYLLPASYDWIWPINARFPLLALMFLPFWLPVKSGTQALRPWQLWIDRVSEGLFVCLLLSASVGQSILAREAFAGFTKELEGFAETLSEIPEGQKVAALVFDRGSRYVSFAPFLHVGAYYQAERGGVAFFSFNDFPQSPVRFKGDDRPPKVEPRWEWRPERVQPDRELLWFDYILVRGGPPKLKAVDSFEQVSSHGRFRLLKRRL